MGARISRENLALILSFFTLGFGLIRSREFGFVGVAISRENLLLIVLDRLPMQRMQLRFWLLRVSVLLARAFCTKYFALLVSALPFIFAL